MSEAHIHYMNPGPWPVFIGVTNDPEAFQRELKRLGIEEEIPFLGRETANATMHSFCHSKIGMVLIVALGSMRGRTKEQVAGLVAHEAMHIVQAMQEELARGRSLGEEAEAYLMQMIVQECLQVIWSSRFVRSTTPRGVDK